jgi:hypothetical protein
MYLQSALKRSVFMQLRKSRTNGKGTYFNQD